MRPRLPLIALIALIALVALVACRRAAPTQPTTPQAPATSTTAVPKPADAASAAPPAMPPVDRDLPAIAQGGTINVLFTFNSTGYLIYRGETMGYEYDLLDLFARETRLKLKPIVVRDSNELYARLNRGEGDVVAAQLAATTNATEVAQTHSLYETAPVVVQRAAQPPSANTTPAVSTAIAREAEAERRRPAGGTAGAPLTVRARLVTTPAELAGQAVHVPRTSPYRLRLLELNDELTQDIDVVEVDESSDRLIQRLAEGEIAYTVAAENLASLKAGEYTNLIIKPQIGPPQPIVWAVRRNAPQLLDALNRWIDGKRKAGLLAALYRKYFLDRRGFEKRAESQYLTAETGTLSPFDDWFREFARIPGWDWRLLAAQSFQESRFNPAARSWAGAMGLMQIMPRTARQLRINAGDPRQAIEGAARYLWTLDNQLKASIAGEDERVKFILGSYNVGLGHVEDAQRLAKKYGDDPAQWADVGYWLIRKSERSVYNDPVVKHGFCRGTEPVAYVDHILARWDNYKAFVTDQRNDNATYSTAAVPAMTQPMMQALALRVPMPVSRTGIPAAPRRATIFWPLLVLCDAHVAQNPTPSGISLKHDRQ